MENAFFETVKVRYSELDCTMTLKPSAMLQFLQDLASDNAEELGFGYSYIIKKNLAWFLLKYRIEFTDYPENLYSLTIETAPRGYNKLFAYRDFVIKNKDKVIGKASSTWCLIDLSNKSIAPVQKALEGNPYMKQYEKKDDDLIYEKIKPVEKIDKESIFNVRFDELDVNKHANNANYIGWALEPLDFEFRESHKIKTIDMVFKKELKYGEKILSQLEISDDTTFHTVKNAISNEELCNVKVQWVLK